MSYTVSATYSGGLDTKKDKVLSKAVGWQSDGSGCSLTSGERDHDWHFKYKKDADAAMKRLMGCEILSLQVRLTEDE